MYKNIQDLKKMDYDVIVRKKEGNFVLFIPELSCIAEDVNLEKAYKKLEIEKEKYFKEMIESDFVDYVNEPESLTIKKTFIFALLPFIARGLIIFIMVFLLALLSLDVIGDVVRAASYQSIKSEAGIFLRRMNEMPEGKKEALKLKLHKTIKQLKPFIDEFRSSLRDNPDGGPGR